IGCFGGTRSTPRTRSMDGSSASRRTTRPASSRATPVTSTTLGCDASSTDPKLLGCRDGADLNQVGRRRRGCSLLVATLVARLAQQFAVLLLRHTLAALLDHRAHWLNVSFVSWMSSLPE